MDVMKCHVSLQNSKRNDHVSLCRKGGCCFNIYNSVLFTTWSLFKILQKQFKMESCIYNTVEAINNGDSKKHKNKNKIPIF